MIDTALTDRSERLQFAKKNNTQILSLSRMQIAINFIMNIRERYNVKTLLLLIKSRAFSNYIENFGKILCTEKWSAICRESCTQ